MISKDQEKEAKLCQDVSNISQELLEWEDREKFLAGAIESSYQNYQVLQQMRMEGKTKLSQERKKSDDLYQSLKAKFEVFQKKQEEEVEILKTLPWFADGKAAEEKKAKLVEIKRENQRLLEEIEGGKESKKEVWKDFSKSCITLAETGLEAYQKLEKLFSTKEELNRRGGMSRRSPRSLTQPPTQDVVEEMETEEEVVRVPGATAVPSQEEMSVQDNVEETVDEEEAVEVPEAGASTIQEEMYGESSVPVQESQQAPTPALSPAKLNQNLCRHRLSSEFNKEFSPPPATQSSDLQQDSALTPGLPSTPKTKTFQLGLGSSIISSLRRGFREKANSTGKDVEMEEVEVTPAVKSPESGQVHLSPAKTPKLKSFKLGLPSFLKKKPQPDQSSDVQAESEGDVRVVVPVKAVKTISSNNNNQSESQQSQPQKKPMMVLTPPAEIRPSQGNSQTPNFMSRLSLAKSAQRKQEAIGRRSLDQLTNSGKNLGPIGLEKPTDPEAEEDKEQQEDNLFVTAARPGTGTGLFTLPMPKSAALRNPLGESLKKPKKAVIAAASPEERMVSIDVNRKSGGSQDNQLVKKKGFPRLRKSPAEILQKSKKVVVVATATPEERKEPVEENEDEESGGFQDNQSASRDGDQEKAASSLLSSPEQAQFLESPTQGEGFFSDHGNDFSTGFFGGGNNKEGEENKFFASFDESFSGDGDFSFFGDSEAGNDDFFFGGEKKDDTDDDGGLNFF